MLTPIQLSIQHTSRLLYTTMSTDSTSFGISSPAIQQSLTTLNVAAMSAIPGWIKLCSNLAPAAAIVVFMAVRKTIPIQKYQFYKTCLGSVRKYTLSSSVSHNFVRLSLCLSLSLLFPSVWYSNHHEQQSLIFWFWFYSHTLLSNKLRRISRSIPSLYYHIHR
jgi:hypothetical protein